MVNIGEKVQLIGVGMCKVIDYKDTPEERYYILEATEEPLSGAQGVFSRENFTTEAQRQDNIASLFAEQDDQIERKLEELLSFRPKWADILIFLKNNNKTLFNDYYNKFIEEYTDD